MRLKPFMFFTLVGLLAGYAIYRESVAPDATLIGSVAPEFELLDQDGQTVRLSDYAGNLVFLNFWATWCEPCVVEMPDMMALNETFKSRPFKMLAISIDTNWEDVREFYAEHELDIPTALDPGRQVYLKYRALGVPETFFIDGNGNIVQKFISYRRWMSPQFLTEIEELVAQHENGTISEAASSRTGD